MSWEWELTRLLTAWLVGLFLSLAGSIVQLTTRNELASPSTLGMDGLAVGVVLALYAVGAPTDAARLAIGVGLAMLLWLIPWRWSLGDGAASGGRVVLAGLALNLFIGAVFSLMHFLSLAFNRDFPAELWFGRIAPLSPLAVGGALLWLAVAVILVVRRRRSWQALLLGPAWARGWGVPVDQLTKEALWLAFTLNLWVVMHFGAFSFLGLMMPLVLRMLPRFRGHARREMTEGALWAGLLFALLDHACYNFTFHGAEVPVGLPFSLLGTFVLVTLLLVRGRTASLGKNA